MQPRVSCLIPVFNGEEHLEAALSSIVAQSEADFEVVVVNDGSTDRSRAILDDLAGRDGRVRVLTKPNGGIVSALNHGLKACRGEFVARMYCDDIATLDRFAVQLAVFSAKPDAVAVGGLIQTIDGDGRPTAAPGSPSRVEATDMSRFPPTVANVQHSAGMFRHAAMKAVGGYRSTFPHAEDYDLYLRLAEHGRFYNPPSLVLYYRVHSGSLSMRNLERQETSAVLAEMSAYARRAGLADPGDAERPLGIDDYARALGALCPPRTIRRYVGFRLWRRVNGAGGSDEGTHRAKVIRGLFDPRNHRTRLDRALNRRIVLSMGRKLLRIARTDPGRLLGRRGAVRLAR